MKSIRPSQNTLATIFYLFIDILLYMKCSNNPKAHTMTSLTPPALFQILHSVPHEQS